MEMWEHGNRAPRVEETVLKATEIQVERKRFNLMLRENLQGQFVRITEVGPRKNSIIIPVAGLGDFCATLAELQELAVAKVS